MEPNSIKKDGDESVEEWQDADGNEESVPEPENQIHLLVDHILNNIQWAKSYEKLSQPLTNLCQDTHAIVFLLSPCCSHVWD